MYIRLAVKYIFSNKTKSFLIILGFSLAVALAVTIGNVFDSVITTEICRYKADSYGYDFGYSQLTTDKINSVTEKIKKNENVEFLGIVKEFGYSKIDNGINVYLRNYDDISMQMFGIRLKEGAMPHRGNEACLEQSTMSGLSNKPEIGQKFWLEVTDSYGVVKNVSFILSGILEDTKNHTLSLNQDNILLVNSDTYAMDKEPNISLFVKLKKYAGLFQKSANELEQIKNQYSQYKDINDLVFIRNEHYLNSLNILNSFAAIRIGLMVFSILISIFLVFNLIAISVSERIRQYGLLRCIGISGKQLKLVIAIEAVLLSVPSIPIGTVAGCTFSGLMNNIISPILMSKKIYNVFNYDTVIFISISIIITAIVATLIPGEKAGKYSPIEACMGVETDGMRIFKKNIIEKMAGRFVDIIKMLAVFNIKRNRSKVFFTVATLALSGFVFLVLLYFYNFISDPQIEKTTSLSDFELKVPIENSERFSAEDLNQIKNMSGIKEVYGFNTDSTKYAVITDKRFLNGYKSKWAEVGYSFAGDFIFSRIGLLGCNDTLLNKLDIDKNILKNITENNKEYLGIFSTRLDKSEASSFFKLIGSDTEFYITSTQTMDIEQIKKSSPRIKPRATVYLDASIPFGYSVSAFYMPISSFEKLTRLKGYSNIYINIEKDADRNRIASDLEKIARLKSTAKLRDGEESKSIVREFFYQISMLVFGLSILILIIGVVNMFITIKSNIILRMNELGTLIAVGMSKKDMRKMFLYEGMYYGVLSSVGSTITSVIFCCTVFGIPEISDTPFLDAFLKIPWEAFISAFFINIILCISVTLISIRPLYNMSTVEAIRYR